MKKPAAQRLKETTDRSGGPDVCWPWLRGCTHLPGGGRGYGQVMVDGKARGAHVVALELETGEPANGRMALHSCDNPPCCNPAHLRWGTREDNAKDRRARGVYGQRGTAHPGAKLTAAQVDEIRKTYQSRKAGCTLADLGLRFGVHLSTIHLVVSNKHWRI